MLNQDFQDILSEFCTEQVEFIVVGAYALAAHGMVRATGNLDLWIRCSDENAQRVWRALKSFGAPLFDLSVAELKTSGTVFQIGWAPRRIDILTKITAVDFDEAWQQRKQIEIAGMQISTLGKQHLLQNKKAAGRPKDLADVAWLETSSEEI